MLPNGQLQRRDLFLILDADKPQNSANQHTPRTPRSRERAEASEMNAFEAINLQKSFCELHAVQGVDFAAKKGAILSLLGPNGAGKSTIISMLSGILLPDEGDAFINGYSVTEDPQDAKTHLGVVPQDIALYQDLSAGENLVFWGKMYGLRGAVLESRVEEVLEMIGLTSREKDRVSKFSGGMKRRLNIGVALLHKPDVLIMDEPTIGLDPQSRRHILNQVKELNQQGMAVLHTTHRMEEAAELADNIAIMDSGRIVAFDTHSNLIKLVGEQSRIDLILNVECGSHLKTWGSIDGISHITSADNLITVMTRDSERVLPHLLEAASQANVHITSIDIQEPNLESVFLHLTGRSLRD